MDPTLIANQTPMRKTRGSSKLPSGFQGKGRWKNMSEKDRASARVPSAKNTQRDSVTEAVTTGARNKIENGFVIPPVNQRRAASCKRSKPNCIKASKSLTRRSSGQTKVTAKFTITDADITTAQAISGYENPNIWLTINKASV